MNKVGCKEKSKANEALILISDRMKSLISGEMKLFITLASLLLLILFSNRASSQTSTLYNFNTSGQLSSFFNGSGPGLASVTQSTLGGIGNTGAINVPLSDVNAIFSTKEGYSLGPVGSTYTFESYIKSEGNSGYSGLGFTASSPSLANTAGTFSEPFRPSDALGINVHGGGFIFHNGSNNYSGNWGSGSSGSITAVKVSTISDLLNSGSPDKWYKIIFKITRATSTTFDMRVEVWRSNNAGTLLNSSSADAIFEVRGVTNTTLQNAPIIYSYFNFSGTRVTNFDNYKIDLAGGGSVIQQGAPVVLTTSATNSNNVVTVAGNVTSANGSTVTERGFVYGTSANPTISNSKVVVGSGLGTYSGVTPTLSAGTYYFRAYATNSTGTSYGAEQTIVVSAPVLSSNANLSALTLSSGTLSPTFSSSTTSYTASVPYNQSSITVTPTIADATASVKVNGTTVTSGQASTAINLNEGANTITVLVTAQDGTTTKTYTTTITRVAFSTLGGITIVASGGAAENSGWSYANGILAPTSSTAVNVNASDVVAKMTSANLTIAGSSVTINSSILSTTLGRSLTLQSASDIILAASTAIQTNNGAVVVWANADGQTSNGSVLCRNASSITTNGGHLWIGGGSVNTTWNTLTVGNGYAVAGTSITPPVSGSPFTSGIYLENTNISTDGGHIELLGQTNISGFTVSFTNLGTSTINSGTGKIRLVANATTAATGALITGMHNSAGTQNANFTLKSTFDDPSQLAIDINASTIGTATTTVEGITTLQSTGRGKIQLNSISTAALNPSGLDLGYMSFSGGNLNVLSASGEITINTGGSAININNSLSSASLGFKSGTDITTSTSNITLISNNVNSVGNLNYNTNGILTIKPTPNSSFTTTLNTSALRFSSGVSGLIIGQASNTGNITIGSATTIAGPIQIAGGTLAINGALTATNNNITLTATTGISQTAAITANALILEGAANATLTNANNSINTISGGTSTSRIGALNFANNKTLTVSSSGIFSTGLIELATSGGGDVEVAGVLNSNLSTGDVVKLYADKAVSAGVTTGGNIKISGIGALSIASGARALLYSGSESLSTGLTTAVGGTVNTRKNISATTTISSISPALSASGTYALYREASTLPVMLVNYEAKVQSDGIVALNWLTASEKNNSYFEILRSTDGINFSSIGKLDGFVNSSQESRYSFIDTSPLEGINYYLLVQYDQDGTRKELGVRSVKISLRVKELVLYPNPTKGLVNISLAGSNYEKLEVIDLTGKILLSKTIGRDASVISIDLGDLSSGIYQIRLSGEGKLLSKQIIKQ